MPREYELSDEIKRIAERLIEDYHPHLKPARIAYVMKRRDPDKQVKLPKLREGKKSKVASARRIPDLYLVLCEYDFILLVDELFWDFMKEAEREALVDHELCHCMHDEDGWYVRDHDVEEFRAVIERHGFWQRGLEEFVAAAPPIEQKSLPFGIKDSEMRVQ